MMNEDSILALISTQNTHLTFFRRHPSVADVWVMRQNYGIYLGKKRLK